MKKSFILHYDKLEVLETMTDEQAWKLFKKIRSYHNGNTYEPKDQLVDAVFVFFKNQFDKDNEKREEVRKARSEAGKMWGRPKKSKWKQKKQMVFEESKWKQSKTKKAVTVTGTVTDTATATVSKIVSSKEEEQSSTLVEYQKKDITKKIDHLVNMIKEKCDELGVAYDKDKDRNFARHILIAKEYWRFCENINMSREDFAVAVLQASVQIKYRKWARTWPRAIYKDYADVYNQAKSHIQSNQVVDLSMYNKPND